MRNLVSDLRNGIRTLVRNPGFSATAVLLLALGLSLASCQLIRTAITAGTSRVAHGPLCLHAVANTPAGLMEFVSLV
jgi:hypothetical protein